MLHDVKLNTFTIKSTLPKNDTSRFCPSVNRKILLRSIRLSMIHASGRGYMADGLVNKEIYVLRWLAHTSSRPPACKSFLVSAGTFRTIHLAVLMSTVDRSKVTEFHDWITPDCLPIFLPAHRTSLCSSFVRGSVPRQHHPAHKCNDRQLTMNWSARTRRSISSTEPPIERAGYSLDLP